MSEEMKPCPFCGGAAHTVPDSEHSTAYTLQHHSIGCPIDDLLDWYPDKDQAVAAWNTRTPPRVKALDWRRENERCVSAAAAGIGTYAILVRDDGQYSLRMSWSLLMTDGVFGTEPEAKSAAQADITRRVLACLEGYDEV